MTESPNDPPPARGYPPPPPQPYSDAPAVYPGSPAPRNGAGVGALVAGLLSLPAAITVAGGVILGVLAIALGVTGRRRAGRGEADNRGMATVGLVTGILGVLASVVALILFLTVFDWFYNEIGGRDLISCLQDAGNDRAAQQACENEFATGLENQFGTSMAPVP